MIEKPLFRLTPSGVEIVGDWPNETTITRELLEQGDPDFVVRCGRTITLLPGRGEAAYRMVRRGPYPRSYLLRRL